MSNKSSKAKAVAALALIPIACFSTFAAGAQYVPLFDAQVIKPSFPDVNIASRFVYKTATVQAYCDAPATAYIKTDNGNGTYGPPLADNYITSGDDLTSACQGPQPLPSPIAGSHCFASGSSDPIHYNQPIETVFSAANVSAPIALNTGANSTTFKLWDYGGVYGNTKLVLELPSACNTINQWCSPGYWKNHPAAWAPLAALTPPVLPTTIFNGPSRYDATKRACKGLSTHGTLMEVISNPSCYGGEAANAVADILSDAHPDVSFYGVRVEGSCPLN